MSEQEEIERLIAQIRSVDHAAALAAIEELQERGDLWLGRLRGANLSGAKLHGVNLTRSIGRVAFLNGVNLTGADLSEAHLDQVCFAGANLHGVDLSDASLREADLQKAILDGAIVDNADLSETDLSGASMCLTTLVDTELVNTILSGAIFFWADLSSSNLRASLLQGTSFIKTRLEDTNLERVRCYYSSFVGVDLSTVKGMDTIIHLGPSDISLDTLQLSEGRIPEVFLRGCGVPEEMIAYLPALTNTAIDFYSCFISYNHTDKVFARRVHDTLQGRGIRCWLDEHQMLPGDPIHESIDRGIRIWDKVLLCCSKSSMRSWWVEREFDKALQKEEELSKRHGKNTYALIPLDLDGYIFSDECDNRIARTAKERLAVNFQGWEHDNTIFEREIERVIRALRTDGGRESPPEPKL